MNDLQEIKLKIYEQDRVKELLEHMECERIRPVKNRYEAQLPEKFNSDNARSVQVYYQSELLPCRVRSRGMTKLSVFDLVSYVVFDCEDTESIKKNLPKSKRWICEKLGYEIQTGVNFVPEDDPLGWLKKLRKQRQRRQLREIEDNQVYDDSILNQYVMYPHFNYLEEGVTYETQQEFQIGFDVHSERIIYPIHNQFGEIVSVKGRTTSSDYKENKVYKFMYMYPFNKQTEWYNWHRGLFYILDQKEVIIFEGEKSCWLATQFGYRNCLAIGGDDISDYQVDMIKKLGIDIKIILAYDKDKEVKDIKAQAKKFGNTRAVYAMWDATNLLSKEKKQSPTDEGYEVFQTLYNDHMKYRINSV